MSQMGFHDPFGHLKHKLWPKEGSGVKLSNRQFNSRPLKVKNCPDFLACKWRATYHWKALEEGYNFALDLILIEGLHAKLWALNITESQLWEFQDSHLGVLGQNDIWVLVLWPCIEYTLRGKVVASPKSRPCWVLWICVCLWLVYATKCSNYALTNLFFGLCRSMWVIEFLVNLPSPIPDLQHAPLPPKCCKLGNVP
jgi:hypothetical protein